MRVGVTGSVVAHAAVILIAVIALNSAHALTPDAEQSISVDLVPVTDTTHVRAGSEKSKIIDTKTPAVVQSQTPPVPMQPPGNTSQQIPTPNTADKPSPTAVTNTAPAPTPAPAPPTPQPVVPAPPPPKPQPTPQPVPTPAPPPPPAPKPKPQPKPTPAPTPSPQLASSASTSADSAPPVPIKTAELEQQRADLKKQQQAEAKAAAAQEAKAAAQAAAKAQAEADAKAEAEADAKAAAAAAKAKAQAQAQAAAVAAADAKAAAAKKAAAAAQAQQVAQANSEKAAKAASEISELINNEQSTGGRTGSGGTPTAGEANGADTQLTQSEIGMLSAAIKRCWNLLPSQIASGVQPELDFKLNRDGSVAGTPKVVATENSDMGQQIAQSAKRAVLECQPYKLPASKYDAWSEVDLVMDPAGQ